MKQKRTSERFRQTTLHEYMNLVRYVYHAIPLYYSSRLRLSEKHIRQKIEKQGWEVWRGGLIGVETRTDLYPHVQKRYRELTQLLKRYHEPTIVLLRYFAQVQHGMPDFICYKNRRFKFVECKLGYESLSKRQKKCIQKLLELGFVVEVHKLVESCTRMRGAQVNIENGQKKVYERQMHLTKTYLLKNSHRRKVYI